MDSLMHAEQSDAAAELNRAEVRGQTLVWPICMFYGGRGAGSRLH